MFEKLPQIISLARLGYLIGAIAAGCVSGFAAPGLAAVQNEETQILTPEDASTVADINHYLNSFIHLEGNFTQVGPTGDVAEGRFYMRRPGRVRFDYAPPSKLLVIADGFWIGIIDQKLQTTDRYPLGSTPYWALLKENIDLGRDARILSVEREPGIILVTFDDPTGEAAGEITLVFEKIEEDDVAPRLELRQWLITDAQGLTTSVSLADLVEGKRARNKYFVIRDF
ncbi:MAG: LolA family protein [Alphaproteobacteria bacterium]